MEAIAPKRLYAISIKGKSYMISSLEGEIVIQDFSPEYHADDNQKQVKNTIQDNLPLCKSLEMRDLRMFLIELQNVINNNSSLVMDYKVKEHFDNRFGVKKAQIGQLKSKREEIISKYFDDARSGAIDINSFAKSKQKIKTKNVPHNDFSRLGKDAFVNALVLAAIVELVSITLVTVLLLKI